MKVEVEPVGLSDAFGTDPTKQVQWKAFLKRSAIKEAPANLTEVVEEIGLLFAPILVRFGKADGSR